MLQQSPPPPPTPAPPVPLKQLEEVSLRFELGIAVVRVQRNNHYTTELPDKRGRSYAQVRPSLYLTDNYSLLTPSPLVHSRQ